jgi:hypothetical protein
MAEWRHSSTILGLGTRWRLVVSFTLRKKSPVRDVKKIKVKLFM